MGLFSGLASLFSGSSSDGGSKMPQEAFLKKALSAIAPVATRGMALDLAAELAEELSLADARVFSDVVLALNERMGPERGDLERACARYAARQGRDEETTLRAAAVSQRFALLSLWLSMEGGPGFLVDLRARILAGGAGDSTEPFASELTGVVSGVFSLGLVEMETVGWDSSASTLEKLMEYESVHRMDSWGDIKRRLLPDRRIYALFHPGWRGEPLAFVEAALTRGMSDGAPSILEGASADPTRADTAVFYSINAPHEGLRGIPFGESLITMAARRIRESNPNVRVFCTLSPMPGFLQWLVAKGKAGLERELGAAPSAGLLDLLAQSDVGAKAPDVSLRPELERLAARYLLSPGDGLRPRDSVARFHLGNGARLERVNWMGDPSPNGLSKSLGMMVNYVYDQRQMARNKRLFADSGKRAASAAAKRLAG